MKKTLLSCLLVAYAFAVHAGTNHFVLPDTPRELLRQPYLQAPSQNGVTIVWRTSDLDNYTVRFGDTPAALNQSVRRASITTKASSNEATLYQLQALHGAPNNTFQYEATLKGLKPATRYHYGIFHGTNPMAAGESYYFNTLPTVDAPTSLRILSFGCSGTGKSRQRAVWDTFKAFTTNHPPDLFLHSGDVAYYDGLDGEYQTNFFNVYGEELRHLPLWPALGNHDGHTSDGLTQQGPYFDAFVMPTNAESGGHPSGTETYYSFDVGRVHIISLDSYDHGEDPDGPMARWLADDLDHTQADWIIAYWHHPPYSKGSHDSDTEDRLVAMRENIMPILEAGGVDLTLHAHSHTYERTMLLDGAYETPTRAAGAILMDISGTPENGGAYRKSAGKHPHGGMVSVVVGSGGASLRRMGRSPVTITSLKKYGFLLIDINDDTLAASFVTVDGDVADEFSIVKEGVVTHTPMEHPWQPVGPAFKPSIPYFVGSATVSLEKVTGAAEEVIYYTLDGRMPNRNSPVYERPIVLRKNTQIAARSYLEERDRWLPYSTKVYAAYQDSFRPATAGPKSADSTLKKGVNYKYYEGAWAAIPDFSSMTPVATGTSKKISIKKRRADDYFGMAFSGYIKLPEDGIYGFALASDDGSNLSIDGQLIVDNDGLHPFQEKVGYVGLRKGLHELEINFIEAAGAEILHAYIEGPNTPRQRIPKNMLWRNAPVAASDAN